MAIPPPPKKKKKKNRSAWLQPLLEDVQTAVRSEQRPGAADEVPEFVLSGPNASEPRGNPWAAIKVGNSKNCLSHKLDTRRNNTEAY